jgi:hypothetical protein
MEKEELVINGVTYVPKGTESKGYSYPEKKKGKNFCIVRTYSAGVFAGWYDLKTKGKEGIVEDAIRIWYWDGANSLSDVATKPCTKPENCKFCVPLKEVYLKEIIEVIPATKDAQTFIVGLKKWEK